MRENDAAGTPGPAEAAGLLDDMRRLRRDARSARHAYWFPLVLFGILTCAAVPFYLMRVVPRASATLARPRPVPLLSALGGAPGFVARNYLGYYWLVALLGGLAITLLWYRRHARQVGLRTPARGYLVTVAALTGLALVLPLLARIPRLGFLFSVLPSELTIRGTFPLLIIAAGLCVLAWAERSRGLTVIAAIYAATALLASLYDIENVMFRLGSYVAPGLPNVLLPALVLLVGGAGAFVVQRRRRSPA